MKNALSPFHCFACITLHYILSYEKQQQAQLFTRYLPAPFIGFLGIKLFFISGPRLRDMSLLQVQLEVVGSIYLVILVILSDKNVCVFADYEGVKLLCDLCS